MSKNLKSANPAGKAPQNVLVKVDLNNPVFLQSLFALQKPAKLQFLTTVEKIMQLSWQQVYQDNGLNWEEVTSLPPPPPLDKWYSLRVSESCRALAYREGDFMRLLLVQPDHDATYKAK